MNVLFLTISEIDSIEKPGIYSDLLRCFRDKGNAVYIAVARERKKGLATELTCDDGVNILRIRTGNITKCSLIEKGISTMSISRCYSKAIKKYFKGVAFDLIMYATPPITLASVIKTEKRRTGAFTYLLLKDIFPQNACDMGILATRGLKGLLYLYFRNRERQLYNVSDKIGCMSEANRIFVLGHNQTIQADRVEICPNSIEPKDMRLSAIQKQELRKKYGLPQNRRIFIYGGNLGRPQAVPFIVSCLKSCSDNENAFFVVAGSGMDRHFLDEYVQTEKPEHLKLFGQMPKDEYDQMVGCCDVGLIFLDHRFTIPNFPSRLLSYMQAGLPVLCCTDVNTDIGRIAEERGFGWWCESRYEQDFCELVRKVCSDDIKDAARRGYEYLCNHYSVDGAYRTIMAAVDSVRGGR